MTQNSNFRAEPSASDPLSTIASDLGREELEWEPFEPGEQVIGHIAGIEYVETKTGNTIGVLLVDTREGSRMRVWCGRTRLRKQLARNKVQAGDAIGIRYEGEKQPKNGGNPYFDYRVQVIPIGPRRDDEMFHDDEGPGLTADAVAHAGAWANDVTHEEDPF